MKVASVGNSSVDIHYMVKNNKDEIVFTGRGTIVQIEQENWQRCSMEEKEKSLFVELNGK